jgi:hypothetical protein
MNTKKAFFKKTFAFLALISSFVPSALLHTETDHDSSFVFMSKETASKKGLEITDLLTIWNRTRTTIGMQYLSFITFHPTTDKEKLVRRQEVIKTIAEHGALQKNMTAALTTIAQTETMLELFFDTNNALLSELDKSGPGNWASRSSHTLFAWFGYKFFISNWNILSMLGLKGLFAETIRAKRAYNISKDSNPVIGTNKEEKGLVAGLRDAWNEAVSYSSHFSWTKAFRGSIGQLFKQHSPWIVTDNGKPILPEDAMEYGYPRNIYENLIGSFPFFGKHTLLKSIPFVIALGRIWWTDSALYNAMSASIGNIKDRWTHIKILYTTCIQFRQFFEGLKGLLKFHKEYGLHNTHYEEVKKILMDPAIKEIITLLYTNTFKEEEMGYFFNYGRVLFTYKKIRENIEKYRPLLYFAAEYDAYLSIATIISEQQNTDKPFCFVEFIDTQDGALLEAKNAWLPLIPKESIIQDIFLGSTVGYPQHMIITGPNLSGKSMYLKMTGLTAFMAQTWGIAPGTSCKMTLFDYLETCLDPEGNVQEQLSKFAKQKECVFEIQEHIAHCVNGKKGIFLIDEIFNGTVDDIIASKTIEFGESIAGNKNAIVQITTHLYEPTILEKSTHGLFKNFHVDIIAQPDGTFVRTFKVVSGTATWWFDKTQKELRAKFTDWIDEQLAQKRKRNQQVAATQ